MNDPLLTFTRILDDAALSAITVTHLRALVFIMEGPVPIGHIAAHLRISSAGTTQTADKLVALGLATRHHSPDDRRQVIIAITEAGRNKIQSYLTAIKNASAAA